ncbi:MAG: FMN-binding protein [Vicinamibacterales bacterium]
MGVPAVIACILTVAAVAPAAQSPTREEALSAVYPGSVIRAEQLFLTLVQQKRVAELAGVDVSTALVARYLAMRDGTVVGRAYVDTHTVRTKRASLLIALNRDGTVVRVEVTAFLEPPEFRAPEIWLRQYRDKTLDSDLAVNRSIRPLAGATLTTRAVNGAVRRVLAIDSVLRSDRGAR